MSKKKVLVLGGTGVIGKCLVEVLARRGFQVYITSREKRESYKNTFYIRGDAHDDTFLQKVLIQCKWTAIVDFMQYGTHKFKNRLDPYLAATHQYVYISSARVYASTSSPLIEKSSRLLDECHDCMYLESDEYALSKARQENALFECARKNWTIFRPYISFDNNRLQLGVMEKEDWLFRAIRGRSIIFPKDIKDKKTTLTSGKDVGSAIASLVGQESALGETFHATNNKCIKWGNVLELYCDRIFKHTNKKPVVLEVDTETYLSAHPNKYPLVYDRMFDRTFNCEKISRYVDIDSFEDVLVSLSRAMDAFMMHPKFKIISGRSEALKDRVSGERTPVCQLNNFKQKVLYLKTITYGQKMGN